MIAPGAAVVSHNAEEFIFLALGFMCSGSLFQAANFGDRPEHYSVLTLIKAIDKPEHCPWRIAKERSTLTLEHTRQAGQAISRWWPRSHRLQAITCRIKREIHLTSAKKLLFVQEERADQALGCKSRSDSDAMRNSIPDFLSKISL